MHACYLLRTQLNLFVDDEFAYYFKELNMIGIDFILFIVCPAHLIDAISGVRTQIRS